MHPAVFTSKPEILATLRSMDPVAADAARYFADLMLENQDELDNPKAVSAMAYAAFFKALSDANLPGGPRMADVLALASLHGRQIGEVAVAMAVFIAGRKRTGWVVAAVAATVGVAIAALGS